MRPATAACPTSPFHSALPRTPRSPTAGMRPSLAWTRSLAKSMMATWLSVRTARCMGVRGDKAPTQPALGRCVVRVTWTAEDGAPHRSQLYDVAISNEDAAVAAMRSFVTATDQSIAVSNSYRQGQLLSLRCRAARFDHDDGPQETLAGRFVPPTPRHNHSECCLLA